MAFLNITTRIFILSSLLFISCDNGVNPSNEIQDDIIDRDPKFTPDGSSIVFVSGINEIQNIFLINTDGTNKKSIYSGGYITNPELSPDGNWVVFEGDGDIRKKKIEKDSVVQLTFNGSSFHPTWSKDGQFIAYTSNIDSEHGMFFVWKMRSDGSENKRIIFTPEIGAVREPSWFPDGIRLAVARWVPDYGSPEIAIIDTSGNSILVLTDDDYYDEKPKVSNDGTTILFARQLNWGQICSIKIDGSNLRTLNDRNSRTPNWSPNDEFIIYTNSTNNDGRIWIMDKDGNIRRKISY